VEVGVDIGVESDRRCFFVFIVDGLAAGVDARWVVRIDTTVAGFAGLAGLVVEIKCGRFLVLTVEELAEERFIGGVVGVAGVVGRAGSRFRLR